LEHHVTEVALKVTALSSARIYQTKALLDCLHRSFGQAHTLTVELGDDIDHRMYSSTGHCIYHIQRSLKAVEETAIPVPFQDTPATLNRVN
jgi:hypothetical protein